MYRSPDPRRWKGFHRATFSCVCTQEELSAPHEGLCHFPAEKQKRETVETAEDAVAGGHYFKCTDTSKSRTKHELLEKWIATLLCEQKTGT